MTTTLKKLAIKHRKELEKIIEPVEKIVEESSVACKNVSNMRVPADDIVKKIDRYYDELQRRLQQQRDELKKDQHKTSRQKKKEVTLQLEQMQCTH